MIWQISIIFVFKICFMNSRLFALLAAFIATFIYGINYTIAKDVMPSYVKPYGFIIIRIFLIILSVISQRRQFLYVSENG